MVYICSSGSGPQGSFIHLNALRHTEGMSGKGDISWSTRKASQRAVHACFQACCPSVMALSFLDCMIRAL